MGDAMKSIFFWVQIYHFWECLKVLELVKYRWEPSDFVKMILCTAGMLLCLKQFFPAMIFLGSPMVMVFIYIYARTYEQQARGRKPFHTFSLSLPHAHASPSAPPCATSLLPQSEAERHKEERGERREAQRGETQRGERGERGGERREARGERGERREAQRGEGGEERGERREGRDRHTERQRERGEAEREGREGRDRYPC